MGGIGGVVEVAHDRTAVVDAAAARVSRARDVEAGERVPRGLPGEGRGGEGAGEQGQQEAASHGEVPRRKGFPGHMSLISGRGGEAVSHRSAPWGRGVGWLWVAQARTPDVRGVRQALRSRARTSFNAGNAPAADFLRRDAGSCRAVAIVGCSGRVGLLR